MFRRLGLAGKISAALVLGAAISNEARGQCNVPCAGSQFITAADEQFLQTSVLQQFQVESGDQQFLVPRGTQQHFLRNQSMEISHSQTMVIGNIQTITVDREQEFNIGSQVFNVHSQEFNLGTQDFDVSSNATYEIGGDFKVGTNTGDILLQDPSLPSANGNVAIGASSPASKLAVGGNATIGNSYTSTSAPLNGMLVEGTVGVGTSLPTSKLAVGGNATIGNSYTSTSAPLNGMLVEGTVGVGTSLPTSKFAVGGNATIGNGYTSTSAPLNGMLVEGTVGVGTSSPTSKFAVGGNAAIGSSYAGLSAPSNSLIVQDRVGIGTTNPSSFLTINDDPSTTTAQRLVGISQSTLTTNNRSFEMDMDYNATGGDNWAMYIGGEFSSTKGTGIEVLVEPEGNDNNVLYGIQSTADFTNANATATDLLVGVRGIVESSTGLTSNASAFGVYGEATIGGTRYGGYFSAGSTFPQTQLQAALYANGNIIGTASTFVASDRRFKKQIKEMESVAEKVMNLRPVNYRFKKDEQYDHIHFDRENLQYGLIAQELEEVFPEFVTKAVHPAEFDDNGNIIKDKVEYKAVNYIGLIPVMLSMLQEQQKSIEFLLDDRESTREDGQPANIKIQKDFSLDQNHPNPFSDRTTIEYGLPENYEKAELMITDMAGKMVKRIDLDKSGKLIIRYADLSGAGIYLYSLIADNNILDTKKMLVE